MHPAIIDVRPDVHVAIGAAMFIAGAAFAPRHREVAVSDSRPFPAMRALRRSTRAPANNRRPAVRHLDALARHECSTGLPPMNGAFSGAGILRYSTALARQNGERPI